MHGLRYTLWAVIISCGCGWSAPTDAALRLSGSMGAELRAFVMEPQFADQLTGLQPSLVLQPELRYRTANDLHQFNLTLFLRLDAQDEKRTHADIHEAYWRYVADSWELLFGIDRVFWGVAESRHLVDVINQTDAVEDIDEEDKLGQPMFRVTWQRVWGQLSVFLLSGFRERPFPGADGRLRAALPVDDSVAEFDTPLKHAQPELALRYAHVIADWDVGLAYFFGSSREPRLKANAFRSRLIPHYDLIHQMGADVQFTYEAWLWKLEAILRAGHGAIFGAVVAGVEYTWFQVLRSPVELGLLIEYLYDGRDQTRAPETVFEDDVFLGLRLNLNDVQSTQMLLGAILDVEDGSIVLSIEAERRLGDRWRLEFESRWFVNINMRNSLSAVKNDSFITLRLSWFF